MIIFNFPSDIRTLSKARELLKHPVSSAAAAFDSRQLRLPLRSPIAGR